MINTNFDGQISKFYKESFDRYIEEINEEETKRTEKLNKTYQEYYQNETLYQEEDEDYIKELQDLVNKKNNE